MADLGVFITLPAMSSKVFGRAFFKKLAGRGEFATQTHSEAGKSPRRSPQRAKLPQPSKSEEKGGVGEQCQQLKSEGRSQIKVLVKLFQKLAGFQRAAPFGRAPQSAKSPYIKSSAGCELRFCCANLAKTIQWIVFRRGAPCDRGRP